MIPRIPKYSDEPMRKNTLEGYKTAIKAQYEIEKLSVHSSFLVKPSRAKLRKLCFELFKENSNKEDLIVFSSFLGFEFSTTHSNKLKDLTDKFRPIETFFKGETDLADIEAMNMAAVLVDFIPRPYLKFSKAEKLEVQFNDEIVTEKEEVLVDKKENEINLNVKSQIKKTKSQVFYKQITIAVFVIICILGIYAFSKDECMQWQADHYEIVDCEESKLGIANLFSKVPLNENMLHFKKIEVCDTTTFFKHKKAVVWYSKKGNQLEFFNAPGFNPENDKPLKPITKYMIDKYITQSKH
ncbi:MAG: hypothetical protein RLZZ540_728 [Bacteroidota bacterium]|jgi:hypothetical protein